MIREGEILKELLECGSGLTTRKLDEILEKAWGNKRDAGMHCNSMMRRGLIDYQGDGDWEVLVTHEELEEWANTKEETET